MAREVRQIRIESIAGGHSPVAWGGSPDQFIASLGIDPSLGLTDSTEDDSSISTNLLRPSPCSSPTSTSGNIMWIKSNPKNNVIAYAYDHLGSVYSISGTAPGSLTLSGLGDLNDGQTASGNGMAYYDNYMYFATDTTIARYGPLNGSASFTDNYWAGTLAKTALNDSNYGLVFANDSPYPTHPLHRHSDGRLYIADVVGNQGTLHYVETSKTTVEGDTDSGSTYDAINFGYGLYPTAMETYGDSLVIALLEHSAGNGTVNGDTRTAAKLAFWDTTSQKANQILWVECPDPIISAIKNVNGTLYIFSGPVDNPGFRVSRYIGGNTLEEVHWSAHGRSPGGGAVDASGNQLVFGGLSKDELSASVFSLGLKNAAFGMGLHNIMTGGGYGVVTAVFMLKHMATSQHNIIQASDTGEIFFPSGYGQTNVSQNRWYSQRYTVGQPFRILSIRIPLPQPLTANMQVDVDIYFDGYSGSSPKFFGLTDITSANFGTDVQSIRMKPQNAVGDNDFFLRLTWRGTDLCVIGLPITIEYELLDVDSISS